MKNLINIDGNEVEYGNSNLPLILEPKPKINEKANKQETVSPFLIPPLLRIPQEKKITKFEETEYVKINNQNIQSLINYSIKKLLIFIKNIDTEGSNLIDIVKHRAVDPIRTISNDIHEVYDVLGIEACRHVLINEINEIFEQASSYVNSRHLALLADVMTNKGSLMSIDRHGINKSDRGPLAKCSFEETPDVIAKAAIFGELDSVNGVSSNIMLGQEVPIGTGSIDVLFDEEKFKEYLETLPTIEEQYEEYEMDEETNKSKYIDQMCTENMFEDNTFDNL